MRKALGFTFVIGFLFAIVYLRKDPGEGESDTLSIPMEQPAKALKSEPKSTFEEPEIQAMETAREPPPSVSPIAPAETEEPEASEPEEPNLAEEAAKRSSEVRWDQEEVLIEVILVENQPVYGGDMIAERSNSKDDKVYTIRKPNLWPGNIIPVDFNGREKDANIQKAIALINQNTNLTLLKRRNEPNYIVLENSEKCLSYVGMVGGRQPVFLGEKCGFGSIVHEFLHVAGLFHEHMRFDRNQYVKILWDNIEPNQLRNFQRLSDYVFDTSLPFDMFSIMMYGSKAFVKNQDRFSIVTVDNEVFNQQREGMTQSDADKINTLYP